MNLASLSLFHLILSISKTSYLHLHYAFRRIPCFTQGFLIFSKIHALCLYSLIGSYFFRIIKLMSFSIYLLMLPRTPQQILAHNFQIIKIKNEKCLKQ